MSNKVDDRRKKNTKEKKKHSFLKGVLIFVSMLVLAVAVFAGTVHFIEPEYDFKALIPKEVSSFVSSLVPIKEESTSETTTKPSTTVTTTQTSLEYLDHKDFELDPDKKGASIGNLLNGGKVDKDGDYIYHIVDGKGIFRFYTYTESYVAVFKTDDTLSSLNIIGNYVCFVNESKQTLCRFSKSTIVLETLAENITSAYVYGNFAFCVNTSNQLVKYNIEKNKSTVLYTASAEENVSIVGLSNKEIFITCEGDSFTKFLAVSKNGKGNALDFKPSSSNDSIKALSMEDGFMYYYVRQADDTYDLIRQKFGSDKTVTLIEEANYIKPVIVDKNRVFYVDFNGSKFKLKELNMNSMESKTMLTVKDVKDDNTLVIQHGGEYDFVIGKKSEKGKKVYSASSNLTSSTNVMKFSNGSWSYK